MSSLTEEQKSRIEENRKKALEKLNRSKTHSIQRTGPHHANPSAYTTTNQQNAGHSGTESKYDALKVQKQMQQSRFANEGVIGAKFVNSNVVEKRDIPRFVPPIQRGSGTNVGKVGTDQQMTNTLQVQNRNASPLPASASSSTSSTTSSSSSALSLPSAHSLPTSSSPPSSMGREEIQRLIEDKKRLALEIRARKNSANVPVSSLASSSSSIVSESSSSKVPLKSSSLTNPGNNPGESAQKQSSNDLWSRIPETGVNRADATMPRPISYNGASSSGDAQTVSSAKNDSGAPSLVAKISPMMKIKATCVLISKNCFKVAAKYHAKSIDIFKSIEGREYDVKTKTWSFTVRSHDRLVAELRKSCPDLEVEPLPKFVLRILEEIRIKEEDFFEDPDLTPIGSTLMDKIYTFQRQGIVAGVTNSGRILLADDMGLGKTVQAIGIAAYYRKDWPVLVVCPSSVRFQWNEAFAEWLPDLVMDLDTQVVVKGTDQVPQMRKVVITTYDLISKTVKDRKFGVVILDESHHIKNEKTARTKAVVPVCRAAKRVLLLSGTPALSRPKELYTQISAIDPAIFRNFHEYGVRYCDAKKNAWGWDYTGSSNLEELQILLEGHLMIRRIKSEVLEQLPPKRRQIVHLDASLVKRETGLKAAKQMLERANQMQKKADAQSALLEFFHQTAEAKVQAVCEYLTDRIEGLPKVIIFAHHQNILDAVSNLLRDQRVRFIRIDGSTSGFHRQELVQRFNEDAQCKAAVLSIMAANAGLNMATASCVIFTEIMWNPGIMVQAEDRAHRIGQRDSVLVQYLLAGGTSDDHVWDMLARKLNVLGQVGLASASDQSFREADKKYQKVKSDQPTIESFLSQVEEDDEFLRSVASRNGVKDFVSPVKTSSHHDTYNNNNNLNGAADGIEFTTLDTNARTKSLRRSPSKPPLQPQRNTLDRYFPTKRESTSSERTDSTSTDLDGSDRRGNPRREEEANEEDFLDDFHWSPPDDEEDPFLSQMEPNKRRRLC